MKVVLFMVEHWDDVLAILILLLSIIAGFKKGFNRFKSMPLKEKEAYITRLLTNLVPIALTLVTDAEIQFGGGTGKLKRSYVIDELYKRVPDEYKKFITVDNLDSIINMVLEQAENLWAENRKVKQLVYGSDISKWCSEEKLTL